MIYCIYISLSGFKVFLGFISRERGFNIFERDVVVPFEWIVGSHSIHVLWHALTTQALGKQQDPCLA